MPDENGLTHSTYFSFLQVFLLLYSVRTSNTYQSFCSFEVNVRLLEYQVRSKTDSIIHLQLIPFYEHHFHFSLKLVTLFKNFLVVCLLLRYDLKSRIVYISVLQGDFF